MADFQRITQSAFCVLLFVFLALFSILARSETMTPVLTQKWIVANYPLISTANSQVESCQKWLIARGADYIYEGVIDSGSNGLCKYHSSFDPAFHQWISLERFGIPFLACDVSQAWILSGSVCTRPDCVAPQIRNASTVAGMMGVLQLDTCLSIFTAAALAKLAIAGATSGTIKRLAIK
ncbi:hypothetical protein [Propionivibrio sp.]|uniref:hypothetical protein n=1 Tax=Propionivibrio sp. TaxID=2212460 RepID=UPI0026072847|nr:hypothetical protein [Propionivibrio sp.]